MAMQVEFLGADQPTTGPKRCQVTPDLQLPSRRGWQRHGRGPCGFHGVQQLAHHADPRSDGSLEVGEIVGHGRDGRLGQAGLWVGVDRPVLYLHGALRCMRCWITLPGVIRMSFVSASYQKNQLKQICDARIDRWNLLYSFPNPKSTQSVALLNGPCKSLMFPIESGEGQCTRRGKGKPEEIPRDRVMCIMHFAPPGLVHGDSSMMHVWLVQLPRVYHASKR